MGVIISIQWVKLIRATISVCLQLYTKVLVCHLTFSVENGICDFRDFWHLFANKPNKRIPYKVTTMSE